ERERLAYMMKMTEDHRIVVGVLEKLAQSIRQRLPMESVDALGDLRAEKLIDVYVRLAAVHDETARLVDRTRYDDPATTAPGTHASELRRHATNAINAAAAET